MTRTLVAAVVLCLAPAAFAQTFLVPEGECGSVAIHATSSVSPDRIAKAYAYLPKQRVELKPSAGAHSLAFNVDVPADDVVMVGVDLAPQTSGNETRTEHMKAFIRCGAIAKRDDWQRSAGLGLEIIPQWNGLTPFKSGQSMRFIAVDTTTRKLVLGVPMEMQFAGTGSVTGTPDKNGGTNFPYQGPGRYELSITNRRPDPKTDGFWLTDTSTLVFDIH